jgi:Carboxypeptidase regulatory-like domain/TonB dependent receptor
MAHKANGFDRGISLKVGIALPLFALIGMIAGSGTLKAQTAGEGTITGTVRDSTGAVVAGADVTATNAATNVPTSRTTTSSGDYTIAPLQPGIYSVKVAARGFKTLTQQNLSVGALISLSFNPVLVIGEATETVTVSSAPPVLDTTSATLGTVIENGAYANLPVQMNGAQRDPTAFAVLTPGTQTGGGRLPVVGGTGNYLQQLYLEGIPAETINQQGDNRVVSLNVDVDAVDQFQIVTSTAPVEYAGAGAENFTMKSGALKPHGQVSDFVRNTIFDSWSFVNKWQQLAGVNPATGVNYPACSAAPSTATVNGQAVNYAARFGCQPKPYEHQNELSASFGWKVPHTANKLFFFVAYDKFHERAYAQPVLSTIATPLMRAGDFTELNQTGNCATPGAGCIGYKDPTIGYGITGNVASAGNATANGNPAILYDPTSNFCFAGGTVCTRTPFQGIKNGVPTNNVIPAAYISPIAQMMQSFLPAPSYPNVITNNYLGTRVVGFDNHLIDFRVDFDLNSKNRLSAVGAFGTQNYLNNFAAPYIPLPYEGGDLAKVFPKQFVVEDTYTFNAHIVNQLKYGYTRFFQDIFDATQNVPTWAPGSVLGITNLPAGQGGQEFPGAQFYSGSGSLPQTVPTTWTGNSNAISTQLTTPQTYSIVDNVQWLKGRHALTIGATYQFLNLNNANPATFTGVLDLSYNPITTANFTSGSNALINNQTPGPGNGYGYASYLLGAVGNSGANYINPPSIGLQPVAEIGSRYKPFALYAEDNWKVSEKLTLDLGIRWDYLPPFHEVNNHFSFLNPTMTNPATSTPGAIELAGNYGGASVSCGCKTPVSSYWKNFGPRVGLAYSVNEKTVFRAGVGMVYSFGGGAGGGRTSDGGAVGAGQTLGFNVTATATPEQLSGLTAGPSFYLNNGTYFTGIGKANTSLFGAGFAYPTVPAYGSATQILNAGNYLNSAGALVTAAGVNYADPYVSGLAPEFTFYNAGFERGITKDLTLSVNYVGSESHHVFENTGSQNARGYWVNQLNPVYLAALGGVLDSTGKKPILTAAATSANVLIAQAAMPGISIPTFLTTAANVNPTSSTLTVAQGLTAFPQYSSVGDGWGENVQNFSYNSIQITLAQRETHGLQFNVNYTYSKNIGDDGTFRSGFPIPAAALSGGGQSWKADRIDRSWTTISQPEALNAYGVYKLPFGTAGHLGSNSLLVRELVGGWLISGTYQYASGLPVVTSWSSGCANAAPNSGACEPDVNTASSDFTSGNARINGSYGTGPGGRIASNLGLAGGTPVKYIDYNAFKIPTDISTVPGQTTHQYLIGNAPRTRAFNLLQPGSQNLNMALHRSFAIREGMAITFEADCINVWNKVQMGGPGGGWSATASATSSTYGEVTGISNSPRDWQFAGHFSF